MTFPTNSFCIATNLTTSTSETTIVPADPTARNNLTGLLFSTQNIVAATITIRDSTGGTTRMLFDYPPTTTPVPPLYIPLDGAPLRQLAGANNNWTVQVSVNGTGCKVVAFFTKEFGV